MQRGNHAQSRADWIVDLNVFDDVVPEAAAVRADLAALAESSPE